MKNKLFLILLSFFAFTICVDDPESYDIIKKVNNKHPNSTHRVKNLKQLEELIMQRPVIFAMKSTACSACEIVEEAYGELMNEIGDDVLRVEALIEFAKDIKQKHDIRSVPNVFVFEKGNINPKHVMRGANKNEIKRHAHRLTGKGVPAHVTQAMEESRKADHESEKAIGSQKKRVMPEHKAPRKTEKVAQPQEKEDKKEKKTAKKSKKSASVKVVAGKINDIKNIDELKSVLKGKKPVIVRAHMKSCPACIFSKDATEELAKELENSAVIVAAEMSEAPDIIEHFKVGAFPTFYILNKSLNPKDTVVGADIEAVKKAIKKHVN